MSSRIAAGCASLPAPPVSPSSRSSLFPVAPVSRAGVGRGGRGGGGGGRRRGRLQRDLRRFGDARQRAGRGAAAGRGRRDARRGRRCGRVAWATVVVTHGGTGRVLSLERGVARPRPRGARARTAAREDRRAPSASCPRRALPGAPAPHCRHQSWAGGQRRAAHFGAGGARPAAPRRHRPGARGAGPRRASALPAPSCSAGGESASNCGHAAGDSSPDGGAGSHRVGRRRGVEQLCSARGGAARRGRCRAGRAAAARRARAASSSA